jgi:hypothetical protein
MPVRLLGLTTARIFPLRSVTMRLEPFITGLDVEANQAASVDHGREEAGSPPCINRARVNRVSLGNL